MAVFGYFLIAIATIVVAYLLQNHRKNRRFWKLFMEFNGDKPLPIIGNAHQVAGDSEEILINVVKMWERHDMTTFRGQMGNAAYIGLNDPETIETILSSNTEIVKLTDYDFMRNWLGDGLLISKGTKWRRQRKIITPTFHYKILEQFVDIFNEKCNIFIKKLLQNTDKILDVYPYVTLCALDVICDTEKLQETSMGTNINAQEDSESEYVKAVYRISEIIHHRSFSPWKRVPWLYWLSFDSKDEQRCVKILHGMTNKMIQSRKKEMHKKNRPINVSEDNIGIKNRMAFLDLLLSSKNEDGEPLSDESIREEVDTFMFEGHDTTSSCIAFAIYSLANTPHVQSLAYDEQLSIFGNVVSMQPSFSDLQNMNYLERVIKETLRLYPSVPVYGRELINDVTLPDGKILPAGVFALIQVLFLGRNPKHYPDPLKFDPDRFLPDKIRGKNPYLFVPFSAGPRNCIGQKFAMLEIKSILSMILRNFELISAGPNYEPRLVSELILKSKNGLNIILRKRITSVFSNNEKNY